MVALAVQWASVVLEIGVLAGLVARTRWRHLIMLPVLLLVVAASTAAPLLWPSLRTWNYWLTREFTHTALALVMGLELAVRLFFRVRAAQHVARVWIAAVVVLAVVALRTAPPAPVMTILLPRCVLALVWLYAGLTIIASLYFVPIDPLHNVTLRAFALYMGVYGLAWALTGKDTRLTGHVNALAFDLLLLVLLRAAWHRHGVPAHLPQRTLDHFWPWRRGGWHKRRTNQDDATLLQPCEPAHALLVTR